MIRVIYRWKVSPENREQFTNAWRQTTNLIHQMVDGANGSILMTSLNNKSEMITMAKWSSLEEWKQFWGNANPKELYKLNQLAERLSVEVFEEVEDQTK